MIGNKEEDQQTRRIIIKGICGLEEAIDLEDHLKTTSRNGL